MAATQQDGVEESSVEVCGACISIFGSGTVQDGELLLHGNVDRTGLVIWRGARDLCRWLSNDQARTIIRRLFLRPRSLLVELGGGIGLGAMSWAVAFPGTQAITTDCFEPALALARGHLERNSAVLAARGSTGTVRRLDWCVSEAVDTDNAALFKLVRSEAASPPHDTSLILLGCDVVYPSTCSAVLEGLLSTTAQLCRAFACASHRPLRSSHFIMTFVERDAGSTLRQLLVAAAAAGFAVDVLMFPGRDPSSISYSNSDTHKELALVDVTVGVWKQVAGWIADRALSESAIDATSTAPNVGLFNGVFCSYGTWILLFRLNADEEVNQRSDGIEKATFASASRADHGGSIVHTAVAATCGPQWVTFFPWLWVPSPLDRSHYVRSLALVRDRWELEREIAWIERSGVPRVKTETSDEWMSDGFSF